MPKLSRFLLIVFLFLASGKIYAQQSNVAEPATGCAFDKVHKMLLDREDLHVKDQEHYIKEQIDQWLATHPDGTASTGRYFPNGPDFIIPVVVHIVHNGEPIGTGTNISYDQVKSQIDALNAGFSNYSSTANYYQSLAGTQYAGFPNGPFAVDTRIRFCLATIPGPGASWTSAAEPGVMRYNNATASRHEYSVTGQTQLSNLTQPGNIFNSANFLNIWVVTAIRFGGNVNSGDCPGIQGYATIAGYTGPEVRLIEGVVIRSDIFGDNSVNSNAYALQPIPNAACPGGNSNNIANRGKIAVHEVGHYLGLYHTFHECSSSTAALCSSTGDLICDTNPCDQPGVNTSCGVTDMPENFMYYSADNILNTFTAGQKARMQAMLNTVRAQLVTESNVLAAGVLGANGCFAGSVMAEFTMPNVFCVNTPATFANVNNASGSNLANQWQWQVIPATGVTIASPNAATTDITFTASGSYVVKLTASNSGNQTTSYQQTVNVVACEILDCRKNQVHWIFGWGHTGVDFSNGQPVPQITPSPLMITDGNQESYITESDPQTGNLLFYTNGFHVYNASHNRITTTPLHPLPGGTMNSNAQITCIPYPGHPRQYLLVIPNPGWYDPIILTVANNYPPFYIHLVDMTGSGVVSPFSCQVSVTAPPGESVNYNQWAYNEQITSIPHANGRDYWIILPVKTVTNRVCLASFLVNPAGITQKSISIMAANSSLMAYGSGIVANKEHNRIAFKYNDNGFNTRIGTCTFNNSTGSFGTALTYNIDQFNIPLPGGLVFYDETHVYLSRTTSSVKGLFDMDLLTGTGTSFSTTSDYGRPEIGPDGNVYIPYKPIFQGPGSVALSRIDRIAGAPSVTTVIPASQLTPSLVSPLGANFWNLPNTVLCPPDSTLIDFTINRIDCDSYQFFLTDSTHWRDYTVTWNFGDGSASITAPYWQVQSHDYAIPGSYTVSIQLNITGCAGTAVLPATPVTHLITTVNNGSPLSITGSTSICLGSDVHELQYSTNANATAQYSWTLTGNGNILAPASGIGVNSIQIYFGNTAGPRTLQVTMTDGGCVSTGTININISQPGTANAGTNGNATVCSNQSTAVNLNTLITGEQAGGYWIRVNGSGGIFNAAAGTFIPSGSTTSLFQYIIAATSGCTSGDTSEVLITISNSASAGTDGQIAVCENSSQVIDLYSLIGGEQSGGTWEQISGTGGIFSTTGTYTINNTAATSSFRYILTGTNGCSNDTSIALVTVVPKPNAGSDGSLTICGTNSAPVTLISILPGAQTGGSWALISGSGGNLNTTTGIYSGPFTTGSSVFRYIVNGTAPCGNDTSFATVTIGNLNLLSDSAVSICNGESVNLNNIYNLSGLQVIQPWTLNNQVVNNPSAVSLSGDYQLVTGNASGCRDSVTVTVSVLPPLNVSAGSDITAVYNQPIRLQGSGSGQFQWYWSPSNAIVSNAQVAQPTVTLTESAYQFILEVTNAAGCRESDTMNVKVFKGPAYYLPNAFSPNGDGINETFTPFEVGINSTNWFRIYNRYGQLIFNSSSARKGWDGRFKGKPQDTGTYTWMIRGVGFNGKLIEQKGTVILIR